MKKDFTIDIDISILDGDTMSSLFFDMMGSVQDITGAEDRPLLSCAKILMVTPHLRLTISFNYYLLNTGIESVHIKDVNATIDDIFKESLELYILNYFNKRIKEETS